MPKAADMIRRSLPPLPPQVANDLCPREDYWNVDSSAVDDSVIPKRARHKRKNKSHNNSRIPNLSHGTPDKDETSRSSSGARNSAEVPHCSPIHVSDHNLTSDDSKNADTPKLGNFSVLERGKLGQNLGDAEENFEIQNGHYLESTFTGTLREKLPVSSYLNDNLTSQPVSKMFIEEERGFRAISDVHGAVNQMQDVICDQPSRGVQSAVGGELAVKTEKFFHTFSTFCHGLLAGMALWQCIIVYQLGPPHFETADFISHYSSFSQPMQTLFYFFFVICIVSAFDRYDVGNPQCSNSKCVLACRSGIIIVVIYPISLLFSLGVANIDDKMSLHSHNATLWSNVSDMEIDLFYWKILNLGRCIGAMMGWIIIALQPGINNFLHRLEYVGCIVK